MPLYDTLEQKAAAGDIFAFGGNKINGQNNTSSPVVLSTEMGASMVNQDRKTLDRLSGVPSNTNQQPAVDTRYQLQPGESIDAYNQRVKQYYSQPAPAIGQQAQSKTTLSQGQITYINPETDQTQTFNIDSLTPDTVGTLQSQGYSIAESNGNVPSWILNGNTELGKAQQDLQIADNNLNALKNDLSKFTISDSDLQNQISTISAQWDARINDMKEINRRREQALNTTGVRLGSRYTGGAGGVFGGILSEEERQGVNRIGELEAQKQAAITAAKEAARSKNWEVFSQQVGLAEQSYQEKLKKVEELNKLSLENNQKVREQNIQASRDSAVADLVGQGITDPAQLLNMLNYGAGGRQIGDFTIKEVTDALKSLLPSGLSDIAATAAKNGAPPDVIKSILSASTPANAYSAAGNYLQQGSGIVGEYQFYVRNAEANGQTPVDFNTYQNMDANRKAKVASAGVSGGISGSIANVINNGGTGSDILKSLSDTDRATVQAILDYTKSPANLSLRKSAGESQSERERILSLAHLIDPSYDEAQFPARSAVKKDFLSGKSAQNIRSLNTAVGHLDTLSKAADALSNGSIQLWNSIKNRGLSAVGDPRVVQFNTAATAVEGELASVFKGMGATDQEIKVWRDNLNSSQSPAQLKAAIDTAIELMGSRMQALSYQYESGLGKPKDFKILNDKSRAILSGLGADVNALDPVADYSAGVGGEIIKNEQQASQKLQSIYPQHQSEVDKLIQDNPSLSDSDILTILGL